MGLRALRLLVEGPDDVKMMMVYQMDIFCARQVVCVFVCVLLYTDAMIQHRALSRDPEGYEPEREQTIKLIRAFIEYGRVKYINQGIVRAIVAIAEQQDGHLRNIALETLAELSK